MSSTEGILQVALLIDSFFFMVEIYGRSMDNTSFNVTNPISFLWKELPKEQNLLLVTPFMQKI